MYDGAEMFCPIDGARVEDVDSQAFGEEGGEGPDPFIGKIIQGRYKVLSRLGEGGMGVVYVAEHVEIEKKVALKVLRDDFSKRPEVVERFRQEARSASKIGHAHIVDVTDFGQLDDGGVFFAMEYLQGMGLNELCRGVQVPLERAVPIIEQIARALKAAHEMGIVHRDMKPENVFLVNREENQDFVKILDFGIAKISDRDNEGKRLTKTGMIFGTPEYMSPEQAAGKPLDHRVDIYALGCIMFELFTGRVPYEGDSFMAILTQHMFEPIPSITEAVPGTDVPPSVQAVVYKAMAKEASDRYETMEELRQDLERALVDADYVVEHPGREHTIKFETDGNRKVVKPNADNIATMMDWNSASGAYKKKEKSRVPVIVGVILFLLLGGGAAGAYFGGFMDGDETEVQKPKETPKVAVKEDPATEQPKPEDDEVEPAAAQEEKAQEEQDTAQEEQEPEVALPEKVDVKIESSPQGAIISIEGMGQVCSSAPCVLSLEAGTPLEITAKKGKKNKTLTVTPSEQNREVVFDLKKKKSHKSGSGSKGDGDKDNSTAKDTGGKKPDKGTGGLKIPDLFKDS